MPSAAPNSANASVIPSDGIDFSQFYQINVNSSGGPNYSPEFPLPPFPVGMHAFGANGSEYVFCKAMQAVKPWQCVAIDFNFNAFLATFNSSGNVPGFQVGWWQGFSNSMAFQNTSTIPTYFWAAVRGENLGMLGRVGSLSNTGLYLCTGSPGILTTLNLSPTNTTPTFGGSTYRVVNTGLIDGAIFTTSVNTGSVAVSQPVTGYAMWPRFDID
jgi:hypothetical protein